MVPLYVCPVLILVIILMNYFKCPEVHVNTHVVIHTYVVVPILCDIECLLCALEAPDLGIRLVAV